MPKMTLSIMFLLKDDIINDVFQEKKKKKNKMNKKLSQVLSHLHVILEIHCIRNDSIVPTKIFISGTFI